MVDDAAAKALALRYCELMNAGDLDGVMALFAEDVVFTDPLGTPPLRGRPALREHLAKAIAARIEEVPGTPTGSLRGGLVALPVTGTMDAPDGGGRLRFSLISLIELDAAGLIAVVRIIAGRSDYTLAEAG